MINQIRKCGDQDSRGIIRVFLFIFVLALVGAGCASTHKTTTTETTVSTYPAANQEQRIGNSGYIVRTQDNEVVERSETTATTTETKAERPGIISSTFHAIGYVIALPFIIIGGLFRILFGG